MNCDTAFELMTDAEAANSSALAQHLGTCPRCRQMQETLAPALGFLAGTVRQAPFGESAHATGGSRAARRQPSVTVEALKIAEQSAARLAARCETRSMRLQRAAGHGLRYAAIFAAGVLLAVTFLSPRDAPVPGDARCTRSEASRSDIERSAAEIRALALSCAACHDAASHPSTDRRSSALELNRVGDFDWLRTLLVEDTLIAALDRPISMRRA